MQSLLIEVKNLKEIIYQSCDAFETSANDDHKPGFVSATGTKRGKRAITQARNFSQLYYDESSNIDGCLVTSTHEPSILDDFYSLKSFTLDLLTQHLNFIQEVFQHERSMLEKNIEQLLLRLDNDINSKLDMEVMQLSSLNSDDLLPAAAAPDYKGSGKPEKTAHKSISIDSSSSVDLCSACKAISVGKKKDKGIIPLGSKGSSSSIIASMCASCQLSKSKLISSKSDITISRHEETHSTIADAKMTKLKMTKTAKRVDGPDAKGRPVGSSSSSLEFAHILNIGSSLSNTITNSDPHSSATTGTGPHNNNEDSPGSLTPSRSGRFRSRLNSARSELHFLEDF